MNDDLAMFLLVCVCPSLTAIVFSWMGYVVGLDEGIRQAKEELDEEEGKP
jgi:hypothetical protein